MKNYYMSIIDYSEVRFLTGDITANEDPDRMLAESGILTAKGNPSQAEMRRINTEMTAPLLEKLRSKLSFRQNKTEPVVKTFNNMYDNSDYSGMYLYLTFLYGFVGWRTPAAISLISSRWDLLAAFFGEFMKTLEEKTRKWGAEADEKAETE